MLPIPDENICIAKMLSQKPTSVCESWEMTGVEKEKKKNLNIGGEKEKKERERIRMF